MIPAKNWAERDYSRRKTLTKGQSFIVGMLTAVWIIATYSVLCGSIGL